MSDSALWLDTCVAPSPYQGPPNTNREPGKVLVDKCRQAVAAEAAKEGGFLGFGGTQVSEKEQAALSQLGAALGVRA